MGQEQTLSNFAGAELAWLPDLPVLRIFACNVSAFLCRLCADSPASARNAARRNFRSRRKLGIQIAHQQHVQKAGELRFLP